MAKRKIRHKKKIEQVKVLSYLIHANGFQDEDELLEYVFSGETESIRPSKLGVSAWGNVHKSVVLHRAVLLGSRRITNCYMKDTELPLVENEE